MFTKQSSETCSETVCSQMAQLEIEPELVKAAIPETPFDSNNTSQNFYKEYFRTAEGSTVLKHGYKVWRISQSEEDLAVFCLSLLQFEAEFPLRFFMSPGYTTAAEQEGEGRRERDIWLETQFLMSSSTSNEQTLHKEISMESRVFRFFKEHILPALAKFKEERINWVYMTTDAYTDEKVVHEFNDKIVRGINKSFRVYCRDQ